MSEDVCRMCLQRGTTNKFISMNFGLPSYRAKLFTLVPELNHDIFYDPVICSPCTEALDNAYQLKIKCLRSEERIWSHLHDASLNIRQLPSPIKLATLIPTVPGTEQISDISNHEDITVEPNFSYYHQQNELKIPFEKTIQSLDPSTVKSATSNNSTCSTDSFNSTTLKYNNSNDTTCQTCKQSYSTKEDLHKHILEHLNTRPHMCSYCYKCFTLKSGLDIHIRVHTQDRPYNCDHCSKSFTTNGNLKTHLRVHTKERPYVCNICDKAFIQKVQLNTHMMLHENQQMFSCDVCGKAFRSKGTLCVHKRIHDDIKPFACEYCEKTFTTNGNLVIHIRKHTGEKPYSCSECDKCFSQMGQLKIHMKSHVADKISGTITKAKDMHFIENKSLKIPELSSQSIQWRTLYTDQANHNNMKIL